MGKYRRKILRLWSGSDTHANTFSDGKRDSYADCNCNAYGHSNSDSYTELHAEVSTHAAAAPDSGTSTLEVQK